MPINIILMSIFYSEKWHSPKLNTVTKSKRQTHLFAGGHHGLPCSILMLHFLYRTSDVCALLMLGGLGSSFLVSRYYTICTASNTPSSAHRDHQQLSEYASPLLGACIHKRWTAMMCNSSREHTGNLQSCSNLLSRGTN